MNSRDPCGNPVARRLELRQGFRQTVGDLDIPAAQLAHQLHVVVARHAQRGPPSTIHHELEHLGNLRAAIHQVTQEDELATLGWRLGRAADPLSSAAWLPTGFTCVAQLIQLQQLHEFIVAPVNIADDVKRPVLVLEIIPQRLPLDADGFHFFQRSST